MKQIRFYQGLRFKFIIALVLVLFFNAAISKFILDAIKATGVNLGIIGLLLNNSMNIIVATIMIALMLEYFVIKPVKNITHSINEFDNGHKETRVELKGNNEISLLRERVNTLFDNIQAFENNQEQQLTIVEDKSNQVSDNVSKMRNNMQTFNTVFTELSAKAEEQLAVYQETNTSADMIQQNMSSTSSDLEKLYISFEEMQQSSKQGMQQIEHSTEMINNAAQGALASKEEIFDLSDEIRKINDIVNLIHDISDQTNLLALNASIEAARAGEHGKGFAVVAQEVRKLAENSAEATRNITERVTQILGNVEKIAITFDARVQKITQSSEEVKRMNQHFEEIISVIFSNSELVQTLNDNASGLMKATKEISGAMEEVSKQTDESTQQMIHMNEAITEQLKQVDQVHQSMKQLKESFDQSKSA
ncbi:HAMP domain-containing methyl-accepting chemotaxis protein [Bacillus tianshenii]|nr:HAMP domain-containing methyl-accepting chemotaxis protein [Bacillus tianshenii]